MLLGQMLYASGVAGWFSIAQMGLYKPLAAAVVDADLRLPQKHPYFKFSLIFAWVLWILICAATFFVLPMIWGKALSRMFLGVIRIYSGEIDLATWAQHLIFCMGQAVLQTGFLGLCLGWVSKLTDIQRFLRYYGSVLKVLACVKANEPWDLPHVRGHIIARMACCSYTSAITFLLLIGMFAVAYSFEPLGFLGGVKAPLLQTMVLLPTVTLAMELNAWLLRTPKGLGSTWWCRILGLPWRFCCRFLLAEPDDAMLEVALVAQRACASRGTRLQTGLSSPSTVGAYQGLADACARQITHEG